MTEFREIKCKLNGNPLSRYSVKTGSKEAMPDEPHNDAERRREALRAFIEREQTNVSAVAKRAGIGASTLYDFLNGASDSITWATLDRLAKGMGSSISDIVGEKQPRLMPVIGYIGLRAEVLSIPVGEHAEWVEVPDWIETDKVIVLEIHGDAMAPFEHGWRVFATPATIEECLGLLSIVDLADGSRHFKRLMRGSREGVYNLENVNTLYKTIEDAKVANVARVVGFSLP